MKKSIAALIVVAACFGSGERRVEAQLHWPDPPKPQPMRVRLVAVTLADPRSSFFSSHEIYVAEREIGHEEWGLIKLVFTFLPYQPRLLSSGFDYSVVHELSASRDPQCDETVADLTARSLPARHEKLTYALHAPLEDLDRRYIPLPCYETTADEYSKSTFEPIGPPPEIRAPVLKQRSTHH